MLTTESELDHYYIRIKQHNKADKFISFSLFTDNFTSLSKPQSQERAGRSGAVIYRMNFTEIVKRSLLHSLISSALELQCNSERNVYHSIRVKKYASSVAIAEKSVGGHERLRNV